jgi:hypothetical protein
MTVTAGSSARDSQGASGSAVSAVDTNFVAKDSLDFSLNFQAERSPWSCPNLSGGYIPGDGLISLDTSRFSYTPLSANHSVGNALVAVGNGGVGAVGTAPTIGTGYQNNPVVARLIFSGSQPIGGFLNTTSVTTYSYNVELLMRDFGGLIYQSGPAAATTCEYTNVQVTTIQGFLNRSSCFIATAAFGSGEQGPVVMLRRFRDHILLKTQSGEMFVRWYYSWSPNAAEWLVEHPVFRIPVLFLLIPLQVMVWLILHPWIMGPLFLMSLGILAIPLFSILRSRGARVEN